MSADLVLSLRQTHEFAFLRRFGAAVRQARTQQHLSQEALGHQTGISPSLVHTAERGLNPKLPLYTGWRLSRTLEAPLDVLCGGTDGPRVDLGGYRLRLLVHAWAHLSEQAQETLVQQAIGLVGHPPLPWRDA